MEITKSIDELKDLSTKDLIEFKDNLIKRLRSYTMKKSPEAEKNFRYCLAQTLEILKSRENKKK